MIDELLGEFHFGPEIKAKIEILSNDADTRSFFCKQSFVYETSSQYQCLSSKLDLWERYEKLLGFKKHKWTKEQFLTWALSEESILGVRDWLLDSIIDYIDRTSPYYLYKSCVQNIEEIRQEINLDKFLSLIKTISDLNGTYDEIIVKTVKDQKLVWNGAKTSGSKTSILLKDLNSILIQQNSYELRTYPFDVSINEIKTKFLFGFLYCLSHNPELSKKDALDIDKMISSLDFKETLLIYYEMKKRRGKL